MNARGYRERRRRGAATIEFAVVLPLLMMLALLIIFFTKGMLSRQNVLLTDRQFAWRQAKQLPPPGDIPSSDIRSLYFRDQPVSWNINGGTSATRQPELDLVAAAADQNPAAGNYADQLVNNVCPVNVSQNVDLDFPNDSVPLAQFGHRIYDSYYREGLTWLWKDVQVWHTLRDHFVNTFDNQMVGAQPPAGYQSISGLDRSLVLQLRHLYLKRW